MNHSDPTTRIIDDGRQLSVGGRLALACLVSLLPIVGGCAWARRGPVADNVIASRELSMEAMEAVQRGQMEQAEILFSRAIESCPTDSQAHCEFAGTLWQRGSVEKATAHMQEAVKLSGGDPDLLVQLGEMHFKLGELNQAGACASRAIQGNRDLAAAWALHGDVLLAKQMNEEALAAYHRALSCQTHFPRVQIAVARIYQQIGRPKRNLNTLENLVDQYRPGSEPQEVLFLHGLALKELGRHSEAVDSLLAASQRERVTADILFELADAQFRSGDRANAKLSVQSALKLNPVHRDGQALLTRLSSLARN